MDWDYLLLAYYENGKKKNERIKLRPYLFIPSATNNIEYHTYDDKPVMRVDFESVKEARNFASNYEDVPNFKIYGSPLYHYVYIYENFKNQTPNPSQIRVLNHDIEVDTSTGFPTHNMADKEVNAITMKIFGSKDVYVLSFWDYDPEALKQPEPEIQKLLDAGYKINHKKCKDEKDLLRSFIRIWDYLQPDAVSGWNCRMFDIPYLIKRISFLFGEEAAKKLSPFGKLKTNTINIYGKDNDIYEIVGIPTIDYIDLYKKFKFGVEESYSLNYLSNKILNATKLDYSEYGSLAKLQVQNPEKFVSYNIIDVIRVEQIDEKVKYMDMAFTVAYETLTNYADSLTTIRVWDTLIHNYLMDRNKVVPFKTDNRKDRSIAGGFVKEPQLGKHKWVMSFDFKSLYPHICMTYNISPDTYLGILKDIFGVTSVEKIMAGELDKHHDIMVKQNVCVTGAGTVFSKKKKGFLPAIMEEFFDLRASYQKEEEQKTKLLEMIRIEKDKRNLNEAQSI